MTTQKGTIAYWNQEGNYGFIQPEGTKGRDARVYLHERQWRGVSAPHLDEEVTFVMGMFRGKSQAENVYPSIIGGQFYNPYNFVRTLPPLSLESLKHSLLGRSQPPSHDRWVGLSGKISCQLKTITPTFVSGSEKVKIDKNGHPTYEFFTINGTKAIPASTLRGSIRSVYEAVTNSCFAHLADSRLSYHLEVNKSPKLVPARIKKLKSGTWKLQILTGTTPLRVNEIPKMPYAALVHQYWPIEPSGTLTKGNPNHKEKRFQNRTPQNSKIALHKIKHGARCYAFLEKEVHPFPEIGEFWDVKHISKEKSDLPRISKHQNQRIEQGWLCKTNQNIERKHSERFFFRSKDNHIGTDEIDLPDSVMEDYETLIREYQNRHKKAVSKRKKPWLRKKKKDGSYELAFSRFIYEKNERSLSGGELVYAFLDGDEENPSVEFIVPVTVPRVLYNRSIAKLLPNPQLHRCSSQEELCPACRMFGWVHGEKEQGAYKGRISLTHASLVGDGNPMSELRLAILSSPNPTTTRFYLANGEGKAEHGRNDFDAGYNNPSNKLRGRKFYRNFVPNPKHMLLTKEKQDEAKNWEQNRTVFDPEDKNSRFDFILSFENLSSLELGALLWTLTLDNLAFHKVGYGKPLGMGSVEIKIKNLVLEDKIAQYTYIQEDEENPFKQPLSDWNELIEKFKQTAAQVWHCDKFEELAPVQDIYAILGKEPPEKLVHYPYSKDSRSKGAFEWFMGNKKKHKISLALAVEDEGLPFIRKNGEYEE